MKTCKNCGCELGEDDKCFTVNAGLPEEYIQCDGCHDDQWDRNEITMCEACGQWYEVDKLHRRDNHSEFTPCPNCGCDIVEALTEAEFDAAYGSGTTGAYEDNSDKQSHDMENLKYLQIPGEEIQNYERLMNLPKGHSDLEGFPKYALIESWTVKFDDPKYEMDIKICSSDYADPLWSEAILCQNGQQVAYSDPESELAGEWILEDNGVEFTVIVIPEER